MGRDKALLPFSQSPTLTEYQHDRLAPYFPNIYISCKSKEKFSFSASFILDNPNYHDSSPLIAIASLLEQLKEDAFFALSVDTPFIPAALFEKFLAHDSPIIVAKCQGRTHPLCALYKKEALPTIQKALKNHHYKIQTLFDTIPTTFVDIEDEEIFLNLNFPDDYENAKKRLQMVKHIVFFQLKNNTPQQAEEVKEKLLTMKENIEVLQDIEVGINFAQEERAYDIALITSFKNREDLNTYAKHPFHQNIITYMQSVSISSKVVDYKY